ncbi:MAG: CDP-glucose 4,6-dehydratase [Chthoniobacteraceae bacterium]
MDRGQGAVEDVVTMPFGDVFRGRRVLLTGHTGFKGAWLAEWLLTLGAEVTGFALAPPTEPSLFVQLGLEARLDHHPGDIRDEAAVRRVVDDARPEFVFHLAAQSLVRLSYAQPVGTFATNAMGTAHVLEAIRLAGRPCVVVSVTSDKCYEPREGSAAFCEDDRLGGHDPYSSSKAAAELVIAAYQRSFFQADRAPGVALASGRAGNVVGGGDWAADRLVPDAMAALDRGVPIPVRNPLSTRPWQHVLEPLAGYLALAAALAEAQRENDRARVADLASSFNFGSHPDSTRSVRDVVAEILKHRTGTWNATGDANAVHEAVTLNLAIDKAADLLGWTPVWGFERAIAETVRWYRSAVDSDPDELTREQIRAYLHEASAAGLRWAVGR